MVTRRGRTSSAVVAFAVTLAVGAASACSGTPTGTSHDAGGFKKNVQKTDKTLNDVYAKLKGLDNRARKQKLISLAKEEGGTVTWYTAAADDDSSKLIKQFTDETGVQVKLYRASSATVLQRTLQEAKAGMIRGDVLNFSGLDPTIGAHNGLYAPLRTPYAKEMKQGTVHQDWIADQFYPFVASWNTSRVPKSQVPKTYKDLLTDFRDHNLAFESTDYNWLFGIVHVLEQQGMTEQAALDLVKGAARGGVPVTGHTLLSQLLAAGKYKAAVNPYEYRSQRQVDQKAHVAWQPALQPIVTTVSGTAIAATSAHPAAALLFVEFQLTEEQAYWVKAGRTPTNKNYKGGIFDFPVKLSLTDDETMYKQLDKWQKLYEQMMQSSGRKPRTE